MDAENIGNILAVTIGLGGVWAFAVSMKLSAAIGKLNAAEADLAKIKLSLSCISDDTARIIENQDPDDNENDGHLWQIEMPTAPGFYLMKPRSGGEAVCLGHVTHDGYLKVAHLYSETPVSTDPSRWVFHTKPIEVPYE